ncbi:DHS-like NAD/FAD-binding domain-containing protein [Chaetomium tenue]|uniref:DHS-like NAD/FAD-binding domain-containing protein n=1 Tax=Chaetomium tenue TaxID=1854479 RepID=A0ACB7P6L9_9PEZI|nr:DHS-like NAD/FAD-binding domain-containing protein [Chaetomium globosum]
MGQEQSIIDDDTPPLTLPERSLTAVADFIKSGKARRIVVMTGAGISTAAGIPDFRSPTTGLYANLSALNLPEPEAVFDLSFFRQNPQPFYVLARELYPGARYRPTVSHAFLALLARRGLLHMLFTQNIDCLERAAGVPAEKIVEAHGSFASQRCVDCKGEFDGEVMRAFVARGEVPRCGRVRVKGGEDGGGREDGEGEVCGGLVKPDIVFFGEALPRAFFESSGMTKEADLILVMGTSLQVHPFAGLPNMAEEETPRVLFNLEQVGSFGTRADDVMVLGDCDAGVRKLAEELGWKDELEKSWRELVGDEEAERQLQGASKRVAALQDEVSKLAEEVDEVLHIDDKEAGHGTETGDNQQVHKTPDASPAEDAKAPAEGSVTRVADPVAEPRPEDKATLPPTDHDEGRSSVGQGEKADNDTGTTEKAAL